MDHESLLDDDTMDFVQLWDYAQGMVEFEQIFTPDDIVLLNEMVIAQNFNIALDLVRHRLAPFQLPEELADIARPKKCIKVNPPNPHFQEPTLEQFQQQHTGLIQIPPPPDMQQFHQTREASPPAVPLDGWESLEARIEQENQDRRQLREAQDMEYIQALIADSEAVDPPPIVGTLPETMEKSHPDAVSVQVVLPDQRVERVVNGQTTTVGEIANWLTAETGTDYQHSTFYTNFPKVSWGTGDYVVNLPVERKRLLLFVE